MAIRGKAYTFTWPLTPGQVVEMDASFQLLFNALHGLSTTTTPTAGTVLQVVNAKYSTPVASNTNVFADTGLTATITPTAMTSKILVMVHQAGCGKDSSNTYVGLQLLRDASSLTLFENQSCWTNNNDTLFAGSAGTVYLDSPLATTPIVYKTQMKSAANSAWAYVQVNSSESTIALMEIAG
jgi:hypothetical protein